MSSGGVKGGWPWGEEGGEDGAKSMDAFSHKFAFQSYSYKDTSFRTKLSV